MIIACENCGSKFKVPEQAIRSGGRFVRCSLCEHEWLFAGPLPINNPEPEKPKNPEVAANTKTEEKNFATAEAEHDRPDIILLEKGSHALDTTPITSDEVSSFDTNIKIDATGAAEELQVEPIHKVQKDEIGKFGMLIMIISLGIFICLCLYFKLYDSSKLHLLTDKLQSILTLNNTQAFEVSDFSFTINDYHYETTSEAVQKFIAINFVISKIREPAAALTKLKLTVFDKHHRAIGHFRMTLDLTDLRNPYKVETKFPITSNPMYIGLKLYNQSNVVLSKELLYHR